MESLGKFWSFSALVAACSTGAYLFSKRVPDPYMVSRVRESSVDEIVRLT